MSRATNELAALFDRFCSDKGTFWQSRHHYANAYHSVLGPMRDRLRSFVEIGIGEDTAPSVAAWLRYFPHAHIYPIDIKDPEGFAKRARPFGQTERLVRHQAQFGCEYHREMWQDPRVHLSLGVDASDPAQLKRLVDLPGEVDVVLDDGSHLFRDQEATLQTLWPRLRLGGVYIIEDLLVGALPWSAEHARQVPTNNTQCGGECFFPQRPAEHPLLHDRFGLLVRPTALNEYTATVLRENDWFWAVTGVHKGGGLDASLIIRKGGEWRPPIETKAVSIPYLFALLAMGFLACMLRGRDRPRLAPI